MKARVFLRLMVWGIFLLTWRFAQAETIVNGMTVTDSVHWTSAGSPYRVQGNIQIGFGAALVIEANTQVIVEGNFGFQVQGSFYGQGPGILFEGKHLDSSKHILWQGISVLSNSVRLHLNGILIRDCRVALDFSTIPFYSNNTYPNAILNELVLENNQIAIRSGIRGTPITLSNSRISNNTIGFQGDITKLDSLNNQAKTNFSFVDFVNNDYAISNAVCAIYACKFKDNDTAITEIIFSEIDSSSFINNQYGLRGHSLTLRQNVFSQNYFAIDLAGRNEQRDLAQYNSIVDGNRFQGNTIAIKVQDGHMLSSFSCNLLSQNSFALILPDRLMNMQGADYLLEKNGFNQNGNSILVTEQLFGFTPVQGSSVSIQHWLYNIFSGNGNLLDNASSTNLNLFKNYIVADKALIEASLTDGDDSIGIGLVNYTVCSDSSQAGTTVTVTKIEDVIKHNGYDSTDVAGTSFSYELCPFAPGNPLPVFVPVSMDFQLYPNPFSNMLTVAWDREIPTSFHLYNLMGQELNLSEANPIQSPAHFELSHLPSGIYLLRVHYGPEVRTFKVVKE